MEEPRCTYEELHRRDSARTGRLTTRRGAVDTPAFMPVGTVGTVKTMLPEEVAGLGAQIILGNTLPSYGKARGGDAGPHGAGCTASWAGKAPFSRQRRIPGFQLGRLRKVSEEGVEFRSHLDGAPMELSPERCVQARNTSVLIS